MLVQMSRTHAILKALKVPFIFPMLTRPDAKLTGALGGRPHFPLNV